MLGDTDLFWPRTAQDWYILTSPPPSPQPGEVNITTPLLTTIHQHPALTPTLFVPDTPTPTHPPSPPPCAKGASGGFLERVGRGVEKGVSPIIRAVLAIPATLFMASHELRLLDGRGQPSSGSILTSAPNTIMKE